MKKNLYAIIGYQLKGGHTSSFTVGLSVGLRFGKLIQMMTNLLICRVKLRTLKRKHKYINN